MRTIKWGRLAAVLKAKGVVVEDHGSEKKLTLLLPGGGKRIHILQHECCRSRNADVWATHLSKIKTKFGITDSDLQS